MKKHCCACVCALAALVFNTPAAVDSTNDPSTLPLLQFDDLHYVGAFRLPSQASNGDTFEIGGHPVAYNPERNSLFVGSRLGKLAEVSIPAPVNSADVTALPRASYLQGFFEPTEGRIKEIDPVGASVDGILVYGSRLYGTGSVYYDANNTQTVSHFSRSLTLNQQSFAGWSRVWEAEKSGFVSGYMALVPGEWQAALGGPAITGQFGIPIAWRSSWGPAAFAFDPTQVGHATVAATPLLYYSQAHPTLGPWSGANPTYGATAHAAGVAIIAGTRTILYFGRNGTGPYCYGNGTSNQSLHGSMGPDGAHWCYDPTSADKGQHAYPYRYQIWAYDLNDLAAVKRGEKNPWDVRPYGVWPFSLPIPEASVKLTGIGYDSATQTIYLSQMRAEKDGYANRPVIHVLKVGGVSGSPLPVPAADTPPVSSPPPTPPPTTSSKVTAVAITTSKPAPQAPGTAIVLTATPNGGTAPHEYLWMLHNDVQWTTLRQWSTSNTLTWTPTAANAKYKLSVGVRSAGKTGDPEASVNLNFPISGTAATTVPRVTSVGIAANKVAPQAPATAITFTAIPIGGTSPQYKWRVSNGSSWTSGSWTASNTYTWTPAAANASYRIEVWARSSGNTADQAEALVAMDFPVLAPASTTPPATPPPGSGPPPASSTKVSYVSMTASKASPQPPGTTIILTAEPIGGVAPHQYQWSMHDGVKWTTLRTWSASNTLAWTPTAVANPRYQVGVQVRSAGRTSEIEEAKVIIPFTISTTAPPSTAPPATGGTARVSSVVLASNTIAPQNRGTAIAWTAVATGGVAPYQYKFYVWDSAAWVVMRGWSTSNTFTWTPSLANPYYKVSVQVRSAGNASDDFEASATSAVYQIK